MSSVVGKRSSSTTFVFRISALIILILIVNDGGIILANENAKTTPKTTAKIAAGNGEFSYNVAFKSPDYEFENYCSGAVIGKRHVLTAAWCAPVADFAFTHYRIVAGCTDTSSEQCVEHEVEDVDVHPNYDGMKNNIAVITVREPFNENVVKTIPPIFEDEVDEDEPVIRSGWNNIDGRLEWTTVTTTDELICHKYYNVSEENSNFFCTTPGVNHWADIGAPVVMDGKIVGVTQYTIKGAPDCHVRVHDYLGFIKQVFRKQEEKQMKILSNMKNHYRYDEDEKRIVRDRNKEL